MMKPFSMHTPAEKWAKSGSKIVAFC